MRLWRLASWFAAGTAVGLLVFAAVVDTLASSDGAGALVVAGGVLVTLTSTGVGLLLATRRRDNPIGWLLLANGVVLAAMGCADAYAAYAVLAEPGALPGASWAVLFSERGWPLLFACVTAIAWLFPDGRLPSPRWRPFAVAASTAFGTLAVLSLLDPERFAERFASVSSPLPSLPDAVIGIPLDVSLLLALGAMVGGGVAVISRLRRSTGSERLQLKWLAYAVALIPGAVVACVVEIAFTDEPGVITFVATMIPLITVPAAVGVAVMRHRLYEIDRLINRTLVYAGLTVVLAAMFAAVSALVGVVIGSGSMLATVAATLAVAALFGPVRSSTQVLVDRRFDRARYDGLRTVARYLEELRAGRVAPETTGEMLAEALGDPNVELLFWNPVAGVDVDAAGRIVTGGSAANRTRTPVRRGTFPLATVVHDQSLNEHPDLLESVIHAAGLAIEIARLQVEVRRQLSEVEESRARIVRAGDEERRRLERDLHDGSQQRLVSIGLALRHLQGQLPAAGPPAEILDATVTELSVAIDELRELAHGVRPAGLDDGLARALPELATRSRLRTRVEVTDERFEDRLETAAYFVASEALANAAKHAHASSVTVTATRRNGSLIVCVADDGVGGAEQADGFGLAGITDRVAALGGTVSVASPSGSGTVVTVELPCAS